MGKAVLVSGGGSEMGIGGKPSVLGLGLGVEKGEVTQSPNELSRAIDDAIEFTNDVASGLEGLCDRIARARINVMSANFEIYRTWGAICGVQAV
jgi:hypothetical protein